ncbi:MAG: hypothetical protein V2A54_08455 [Bacteroidota bacterium]
MQLKIKYGILLLALLLSCISIQAQDADCPCWGEKKAFVAEVYALGGIANVESQDHQYRPLLSPGLSFGIKFNKKHTLAINLHYLQVKDQYWGNVICEFSPCYNCFDNRFLGITPEWKYLLYWSKNFRMETSLRAGTDILVHRKYYVRDNPQENSISTGIDFQSLSAISYHFILKLNKKTDFYLGPFFQFNPVSKHGSFPDHYHFFGGIKAGLKYSKYTK